MNYKMVTFVLGRAIFALGVFLALPTVCAIAFKESIIPFLVPMAISLLIGALLSAKKPADSRMLSLEGFICVALSWIALSLIGCLPLIISGAIPSFIDAFFETISGFTTTGASVLAEIETLPKGILLWRCFTQWIGGMGVLVFLLAVMPKADIKSTKFMHAMKAEMPGPSVAKVVPKIADTARVMYGIYIALTIVLFVLLMFGDMNVYESLCHAVSTAGTGGFGIKNDSLASYSAYSQYVIAVFMMLFAINFNVYFLIIIGNFIKGIKSEELWWYIGIASVSTLVISLIVSGLFGSSEESFRHAFFQVASIMSTTGFSTSDFGAWPVIAQAILLLLMFGGGSAGSTAGGIKISRVLLLAKNAGREIKYLLHPRAIISVKFEGKKVEHETVRSTTSYIIIYAGLLILSSLLIVAFESVDLVTGFSSAVTTLNNVGPGLAEVGPSSNFGGMSVVSKLVLCFNMIAGRLELFPILILFSPMSWKKTA